MFDFLALEDQTRMTKDVDDQRREAEEEQLRLQQERIDADREHERRMERVNYERQEKEKLVSLAFPSCDGQSFLFPRSVIMAFEQSCLFLGIESVRFTHTHA